MSSSTMFGGNPYYPPYQSPVPTVPYPGTPRMSVIAGRSVNNVDEIMPGEVPMDGSLAVFPKSDGSVVYVRSMGGNGMIDTRLYIPAPEGYSEDTNDESNPEISNQDIMNTLADITNQIDDIKTFVKNKSYNKNGNKNNNRNNNHHTNHNQNGTEEKVDDDA